PMPTTPPCVTDGVVKDWMGPAFRRRGRGLLHALASPDPKNEPRLGPMGRGDLQVPTGPRRRGRGDAPPKRTRRHGASAPVPYARPPCPSSALQLPRMRTRVAS